jgi:hypothetical protein
LCYPINNFPIAQIPDGFPTFWQWISVQYQAEQYTGFTIAAFNLLKQNFHTAEQIEFIVHIVLGILQSIQFQVIIVPILELSYYLHILFEVTNRFHTLPTGQQVTDAFNRYHNINNPANAMAISNDQMTAIFRSVFGVDGADWKGAFNNLQTASTETRDAVRALQVANANRAARIVDVPSFRGRDDEDPYEWIQVFLQAQATNGWHDDRRVPIAAGHLKDAAHDWYQADRATITQWEGNAANSFKERFLAYFVTQTRRNQWTRELQNVKQKEGESVEDYSRRFRKLLNKVTQGNALPAHYQINYYINGLSPLYVSQVILSAPADLDAAITRAKLVETGVKVTLLNNLPKDETTSGNIVIPSNEATSSKLLLKQKLSQFSKMNWKLSPNKCNNYL